MAEEETMELSADPQCLSKIETVLFDCDGVLWDANGKTIDGAVQALSILRQLGKRVYFITNNSTKTRQQYAERCRSLGFEATQEEIVCTAWLLASYLADVVKHEGKVYLVGGEAIATELTNRSIDFIGPGEESYCVGTHSAYSGYLSLQLDPQVNAVVVGFDPYINYVKTVKAASYTQKPGCLFVASNTDSFFPTKGDIRLPGTGSIVSFVSVAAGREPVVVGKPSTLAKDILEAAHGKFTDENTLMVGDRMDTDMVFGRRCGFKTLLVFTGVSTLRDIESTNKNDEMLPTYYTQSVADLSALLQRD